jgi:pimeloyl-ACP methyl ester carboxylesterase/DNA-binding winged helix-turn-helix (wHTH) protein
LNLAGCEVIYTFNQCALDTERYQLSLLDKPVSIEPLVFDLLVYLVENRDRVVTREELLDKLWQGKVVTDSALGARLKDARKAVQDSGAKQEVIKTFHGRGYQFIAEAKEATANLSAAETQVSSKVNIGLAEQSPVRFCSSADGVNIAHTKVGKGYPLVAVGSWMSHLEEDWFNPMWGHYLSNLARDFTLIRYDQRGNGMSDWDNVDISFERMVDDLKAVIDCYDYQKVALFGPSQAASVSIAFARQFPERVSHLILYGAYARGRCKRGNPEGIEESKALVTLIRQSWGRDNPVVRQMMTSLFMPDATREESTWFNGFQKTCGPGENLARFRELFDHIDVTNLLAEINIPTLVIQCTGDSVAPLSEAKLIASRIPGARLVTLNSKNHMVFENEPGFQRFLHAVHDFMKSALGANTAQSIL